MRTNYLWILLAILFMACSSTDEEIENTDNPNSNTEETDIPVAILAYQTGANSEDIDTYMDAFADSISILDVNREISGRDNVRTWALNEVIPNGETFQHRRILEQSDGYAKTEVNWLSWVVHYYYWWDENNKITRMSLQYAN
ncbi:hypothetical protein [Marinifilum caeruleilacunae]|uniref:Nuclear transport factor 2 family protein n=1 Tax=Marinifilum caeruleilacunae TaxID=2499076 RepID=A0ABX1WQE0_9BACT|nr:hypothetical protein [Marinifilum caeruleilacunae]NOU58307.1 hypothetical protein [Marinifilum caeruleilacunae]